MGVLRKKGLSQRRSCHLAGIARTVARYQASEEDERLIKRIKELAFEYIRYGYRRIWALLRREGWKVNVKRVWRLWKKERLQVRKRKRRKRQKRTGFFPSKAKAPGHVWCVDFVADRLSHGGGLRMLTVVDEFTRESLAIRVERSLKGKDVQNTLQKLFKARGAPCFLRSDNGSEFIEHNLQEWLKDEGVESLFIALGSPWENGKCESFNGKLRDECLNSEYFRTLREAKVLIEMWRRQYNTFRPHRSLDYQTPAEFAKQWVSTNPTASLRAVV